MALLSLALVSSAFAAPPAAGDPTKLSPGGATDSLYGLHVSGAGDLNGDGWADIIVGAPASDELADASGSFYAYFGSAAGISSDSAIHVLAPAPATQTFFAADLSALGDLDGDGLDDVLVGSDAVTSDEIVTVFAGEPSGIGTDPVVTLVGPIAQNGFGMAVAGAGDIDGDGHPDAVIGAWSDSEDGTMAGVAYVYQGSGLTFGAPLTIRPSDAAEELRFGWCVAGAGDVDGDGFDDVVISGIGTTGHAYVYRGAADGLDVASEQRLTSETTGDAFGERVRGAGDVDADGYDDVLVGASGDSVDASSAGAAHLFLGGAAGVGIDGTVLRAEAPSATAYFGRSVAGVGDLDGDGFDDVAIGAPGDSTCAFYCGAVTVFRGSADGLVRSSPLYAPDGGSAWTFGDAASAAGDTNGDGADDFVIGASSADSWLGAAYVFYGACAGDVQTWWADTDGDGYTDGTSVDACTAPDGYVSDAEPGDCDDSDADLAPNMTEIPDDDIDQDCSGGDATSGDAGGDDTAGADDSGQAEDIITGKTAGGCGCASIPASPMGWAVLGLAGLVLARRRVSA